MEGRRKGDFCSDSSPRLFPVISSRIQPGTFGRILGAGFVGSSGHECLG